MCIYEHLGLLGLLGLLRCILTTSIQHSIIIIYLTTTYLYTISCSIRFLLVWKGITYTSAVQIIL